LSTLNAGLTVPAEDSYAWYQGTSMATPHVSAVAALMLSVNRELSSSMVAQGLTETVQPFVGSCEGCGAGVVDARAAVDWAIAQKPHVQVAEVEPNDSRAGAQVITDRLATVNGRVQAGQSDYFRVKMKPGQTLTSLLNGSTRSGLGLYLYDSTGQLLESSATRTGFDEFLRRSHTGTQSTQWVLEVRHLDGADSKYTLDLSH
jgi:serine protease